MPAAPGRSGCNDPRAPRGTVPVTDTWRIRQAVRMHLARPDGKVGRPIPLRTAVIWWCVLMAICLPGAAYFLGYW